MKVVFEKNCEYAKLIGKLDDDQITLFLFVEATENVPPTLTQETILKDLSEFIKKSLVRRNCLLPIVKALKEGETPEKRMIAQGTAPEPGKDGKVVFLVKKLSDKADIQEDSSGEVDLKDLHLFDNITAEQIVARIYPPKKGTAGKDPFGKAIEAETGKEVELKLDDSLKLEEASGKNYKVLIAQSNGYLMDSAGTLRIEPVLQIRQNIDYRVGNLNFVGKIIIRGNVMHGFRVQAKEGIEIQGALEGGSLVCEDGDVVISDVAIGDRGVGVICGGDFSAKRVQDINIEVKGKIEIKQEARDSVLRSQSAVFLSGAQLIGGEVYAVLGMEGKTLGNDAERLTTIHLCTDVETSTEYSELVLQIEKHEEAINLLKKQLGRFADHPDSIRSLQSTHREKMQKLLDKLGQLEQGVTYLLEKQQKILGQASADNNARVNVNSELHPGVNIVLGEAHFAPEKLITGPVSIEYDPDANEFKVGEQKPIDIAEENSK